MSDLERSSGALPARCTTPCTTPTSATSPPCWLVPAQKLPSENVPASRSAPHQATKSRCYPTPPSAPLHQRHRSAQASHLPDLNHLLHVRTEQSYRNSNSETSPHQHASNSPAERQNPSRRHVAISTTPPRAAHYLTTVLQASSRPEHVLTLFSPQTCANPRGLERHLVRSLRTQRLRHCFASNHLAFHHTPHLALRWKFPIIYRIC